MIGILVTGHGRFATGITSALELVLGKQEWFEAVDFPDGDTKTELERNMDEALKRLEGDGAHSGVLRHSQRLSLQHADRPGHAPGRNHRVLWDKRGDAVGHHAEPEFRQEPGGTERGYRGKGPEPGGTV